MIKRLFGAEPVTFTGSFYQVTDLTLRPQPHLLADWGPFMANIPGPAQSLALPLILVGSVDQTYVY